jgi:DNA-binding NtrC family response regulator
VEVSEVCHPAGNFFLELQSFAEEHASPPALGKVLMRTLETQPWPGNFRELRNLISRLAIEQPGRLTAGALSRALGEQQNPGSFPGHLLADATLKDLQDRLEREYILFHYRRLSGNTRALGEFLGLIRRQLYRRCGRGAEGWPAMAGSRRPRREAPTARK